MAQLPPDFDLRRQQANEQRAEEIESRQGQSTDRGSVQRVKTLTKSQSRSFIGGGATVYNAEVNPTDFLPSETSDATARVPDYYRNGRKVVKTRVINGEEVEFAEYDPMPELVGERAQPVLSSIRLIDPRKVKSNGPSSSNPRSGQLIPEYSKFFLESVQETHNEKFQVVETFNDWYVFFYGEKPPIYRFSGHLLNFSNYNWKNEFMYFYQNFWRGTKAAELGARVFLTYDYQQVQGYILNISTNTQAVTDKAAPFNISMIITKRLFFNGSQQDNVVRDNLIPRTDSGLVNTQADVFSRALTSEFLNGQRPAASNEPVSAENQSKGQRIIEDTVNSLQIEDIPSGSVNDLSSKGAGLQRASSIKRNLGLA